ncbi:MAG TPA: hypothetical protein P5572_20450 [Phycisphaerae bacterium]|nr:hypothetical protein [Phycisphaerae bacterium]
MTDPQIPEDDLKALEREVGDLLAEAESLGDQLASEVGSSPPPAGEQDVGLPADAPANTNVNRSLEQTEAAVADAAREIGSEPPPPAAKPAKKISLPPKRAGTEKPAPAGEAVPPPESPAAGPSAAPAPAPREATPQTGHTVTLPKKQGKGEGRGVEQLVAAKVDAAVVELPPKPSRREQLRLRERMRAARSTVGRSADFTVRVIEWADRPFQRVGYGLRTALGWCALAMLTAAVAIYIFIIR